MSECVSAPSDAEVARAMHARVQQSASSLRVSKSTLNGRVADKDSKPQYIPRQYRGLIDTLFGWQQSLLDISKEFDPCRIHLIYDKEGNRGKSTFASLGELHHDHIDLPPISDSKELLQVVCDILMAKELRTPGALHVDLPRSLTEGDGIKKLGSFMLAIEQIKKGHVADVRHHYKHWWFDSPQVFIYCSHKLELKHISMDRWVFHTINEHNNLVTMSKARFAALE